MRNTLLSFVALVATTAHAQPSEQWPRGMCDLMSADEMRACVTLRPGDPSRSARCDELAQHQIEMCLEQARRDAAASTGATREPEKKAPPEKK